MQKRPEKADILELLAHCLFWFVVLMTEIGPNRDELNQRFKHFNLIISTNYLTQLCNLIQFKRCSCLLEQPAREAELQKPL